MVKDEKLEELEENLEDILDEEEGELLEDIALAESSGDKSLVEQLSDSVPEGTTSVLDSSDVVQDSVQDLETFVRSEGGFEMKGKGVGNDFYSGNKEDDVYVTNEPKSPVERVAGSYEAAHAGGNVYQEGSQDFYDSTKDISSKRMDEIEGIGFGPEVAGAVAKKDLQYQTKTF